MSYVCTCGRTVLTSQGELSPVTNDQALRAFSSAELPAGLGTLHLLFPAALRHSMVSYSCME